MRRTKLEFDLESGCCHIDESESEHSYSPLHEQGPALTKKAPPPSGATSRSFLYRGQRARAIIPVFLLSLSAVLLISGESTSTRGVRGDLLTEVENAKASQTATSSSESPIRPLSTLAQQQAANYRTGSGLLLNLHITHHGGTTFCNAVGRSSKGRAPRQACWKVRGEDHAPNNYPHHNPWNAQETAKNIETARKTFHMISWEYEKAPEVPLQETAWEDPNLFSVLVIRDPIKRLLAGDARVARDFPGVPKGKASRQTLEAFAQSYHTDNYALRILSGNRDGPLTRDDLEAAKALVKRFSVVIDIECLSESLELLAKNQWSMELGRLQQGRTRATPRERIGHDDIYDALKTKNALDIEFYEWAQQLSYLSCAHKGDLV